MSYLYGTPDLHLKKLLRNYITEIAETANFEATETGYKKLSNGGRLNNYVDDISTLPLRSMQAQSTGALCLTCHGANLAVPAQEALLQYYPDDLATGYQLGQVRGAISLSKRFQATSAMSRP
jgi:hypothetical protein